MNNERTDPGAARKLDGGNQLLACLPGAPRLAVIAAATEVPLVLGDVICEAGAWLTHVYFPSSGYVSLLTDGATAPVLEVGLIGREGVFGAAALLGSPTSPFGGLVQGAGTALRLTASTFRRLVRDHPSLDNAVRTYLRRQLTQIVQTAACGHFHSLESRLARWLLMTHDRAASHTFPFTHKFLALMLGARRAGVTEAAGRVQARKLIVYRRGQVQILDRRGLEAIACACYARYDNPAVAATIAPGDG